MHYIRVYELSHLHFNKIQSHTLYLNIIRQALTPSFRSYKFCLNFSPPRKKYILHSECLVTIYNSSLHLLGSRKLLFAFFLPFFFYMEKSALVHISSSYHNDILWYNTNRIQTVLGTCAVFMFRCESHFL